MLVDVAALGVLFDVAEVAVDPTTTGGVLAPADPRRVSITFATAAGVAACRVSSSPTPAADQGVRLPTTGALEFWWQRHGPLVGHAWYGVVPQPGTIITVITVRQRETGA